MAQMCSQFGSVSIPKEISPGRILISGLVFPTRNAAVILDRTVTPWNFYVRTKAVAIPNNIPTPTTMVISETLPNIANNVWLATKLH